MDISELTDFSPYSVVVITRNGKQVNLNIQDYDAARDGEILLAHTALEHEMLARQQAAK